MGRYRRFSLPELAAWADEQAKGPAIYRKRTPGMGSGFVNRQPSAPEAGSLKPGTTGGTHKGLENIQPAPSPAGPANQRATKSGARSKVVLAEHAAPIAVELAARYPHADPAEIENEALRRAAIRLAADWIGTRGQIAKSDGQTLDIARRMVGWTRVSDGWYRDRRTQEQEAKRIDPDAAWDEALKEFNPPDADVVEDETDG